MKVFTVIYLRQVSGQIGVRYKGFERYKLVAYTRIFVMGVP